MGLIAAETNAGPQDTEALYREHGAAVARLCHSLLRERAEAEDAAQQVFLSAHRALLNGAKPREPLAWLLAVARYECYARFRERATAPVPAEEARDGAAADASVQALRAGELAHVWDEVGRMPPAQREAFLLREIRGLSYGQLAEELSLSRPSVRSLLLRARTRLRQRLGEVATGLGGAQWGQALLRLVAGGDSASPVPAATKAAAVGVGALALLGGGSPVARHAPRTPADAGARHRADARLQVRHVAAPVAVVSGAGVADRSSAVEPSRRHDSGSRDSGSDRSGSDGGSGDLGTSSGDDSSGSGHDGSGDTTAVAQPTTDGHDGGGSSSSDSSSSGPGPGGTVSVSGSSSGRDGGGGSGSGSDGGSDSTATTTTTTSSGSDGSDGGHDGGSSGGHGG